MAPLGQRDLAKAEASLTAWLRQRLPDARSVRVSDLEQPTTGGYSNELLFFTLDADTAQGQIGRAHV